MVKISSNRYDKIYRKSNKYKADYHYSPYYEMWDQAFRLIPKGDAIIDLGCGPGQFAAMCQDRGVVKYEGVDFSKVAIDMAEQLCPHYIFYNVDISKIEFTHTRNATIVMLEFLEHIEEDLVLLEKIPRGTRVVASVPNYMCSTHVRCFPTIMNVIHRYGEMLLMREEDFYIFPGKKDHKIFLFKAFKKWIQP